MDEGCPYTACAAFQLGTRRTLLAVLSRKVSSSPMMMLTGTVMLSYGKEPAKFMVRILSREPLSQS